MKPFVLIFTLVFLSPLTWGQENGDSETTDATSEETTAPAKSPSRFGSSFSTSNNTQLLAKGLPPEQVQWLNVGDDKALSLYSPDNSGQAKGGVILLPRNDQPINKRSELYNLQQTLSNHHWHALTVSMPSSLNKQLEQASLAHIESAISYFNEQGIYNMVILGERSSAEFAAKYIQQLSDPNKKRQIRGLALVNANSSALNQTIPGLSLPILDIYFDDGLAIKQAAKQRKYSSQPLARGLYQQVRMPKLSQHSRQQGEDRLSKRVRGWLDKRAAGFSIGVNR